MTKSERRKIVCSVTFHIIAITCVVWSLYVLIDRTAEEIRQGNDNGKMFYMTFLNSKMASLIVLERHNINKYKCYVSFLRTKRSILVVSRHVHQFKIHLFWTDPHFGMDQPT